ncbi:response regulator [Paenalcaligenes suwonensis]|uniref:response regulator n=1 Tax=Paenalcaligenes suwonensis TaxID=1202713 RepID=UPI0014096875|nr:response regulator transcription factor [Paenalcaligenes suwonensis]NHC61121.1 response regulator transcription factor [Paenalcaligenes suwonensis]
MRLLLIEDDVSLGPALQEYLMSQGYAVDLQADGAGGFSALSAAEYELVILDLNLPDISGLDWLRNIRQKAMTVPVLILTARDELEDRVAGLDAGADDYVVKPFELAELAARIRAFARRSVGQAQSVLEVGPLLFDMVSRELRVHNQRLALSVRELSVLEMLMARVGKVVTKQQIVASLSANDADFSENAVEVYVYRLRKRLEGLPLQIQTVRGFGYSLELSSDA